MKLKPTIQQYNNITIQKYLGLLMIVGAVVFNLWTYRLEPSALMDPNDNNFQYALVDRTNQIWDFANKKCSSQKEGSHPVWGGKDAILPICHSSFLIDHWVPNWAEGYNLPYYYSHLPQILIVASYRLLHSLFTIHYSLFTYYHLIIYLLLCFFPLSVFLSLRLIRLSWLAAGIGAIIASHISTDGLYGLDPPSFLWRGYGLSSQLFAMIFLPLAIAYAYKFLNHELRIVNTEKNKSNHYSQFTIHYSSLLPAVFFLAATAAGHLGIGMITFISVGVIAISPVIYSVLSCQRVTTLIRDLIRQISKLFVLTGSAILLLSYWIVPAFLDDKFHNFSFWDPVWKFNSFGAGQVLTNLLNGNLFDFGRFPVLTILVFIGFFAALWPKPKTNHNSYFPFSLLFVFWLVMYFGRTTWGGLLDLIPGIKEFHQSRFGVGVHLAGLFLIPIGINWIVTNIQYLISKTKQLSINYQQSFICLFVYLFIGLFVYLSISPQTIRYSRHNDTLIRQANVNFLNVKSDIESLFTILNSQFSIHPGRVYFGRGSNWGKSFKVAETPWFIYGSTFGVPAILWMPQTWSPNSDTEQYFNDAKAEDYALYNIRYVVTPPAIPASDIRPFWKLLSSGKTWKLYGVVNSLNDASGLLNTLNQEAMGYITTGIRPAVVGSNKNNYKNVVRLWIQSDYPKQGLFPQLVMSDSSDVSALSSFALPHFLMTDEATYQIPDGTLHSVFAEVPVYQPISPISPISLISQSSDSDMIFKAKIEVKGDCRECLVVLKQTYHPSWTAKIDSKKAEVINVFPFYNAVILNTPGIHEVTFSYTPSPLKVILLIFSFITIVVLGLIGIFKQFGVP
ncbi:hypothetical protein KKB64_02670 [Patescibacteria group bacterium]|nr:hypothetical protein [Patescibacteria group bacterium]MBU1472661.1 hypothetical protein [Patescibacteria group bacterium]MBU2459899.1 hypothetical protein [Patescibacteria group bacterium]MBU2544711.1 hypothetical protein [Patescibacteria group bacterium]